MPATAPADRIVLEGVPRIGFDIHLSPFPSSVESMMKYIGEPADYDWIMGITGACFRRTFNRDDGGNVDLMYFAPEPHERIFAALGYEFRAVSWEDKSAMVAAIKHSIAQNRPAIAFGIVGPPEAGVVAGYDKGGEVLIGWSHFQDRKKFAGYYEQARWYEQFTRRPPAPDADLGADAHAVGVLTLTQRKPKPTEKTLLASTLRWAIDLERTSRRPHLPDHVCGLAAYDAWAAALEVDADYPKDDPKILETRGMVYADQVVMVTEREHAARFLRTMATVAPEVADELKAAADEYAELAKVGKLWPWREHHFMSKEVQQGLADPAQRRLLAKEVRERRDHETKAVEQLEKALGKLSPLPAQASLKTPSPDDLKQGARWQVENVPGPAAFRAACDLLGADLGRETKDGWRTDFAYPACAVASGEAFDFCLSIRKDGTIEHHFRAATAAEVREAACRMLRVIRHDGEVLVQPDDKNQPATLSENNVRERIMDAIARGGRPVVMIFGEQRFEAEFQAALITGYEKNGDVLTGWGSRGGGPTVLFEPDRQRKFDGWFAQAKAFVIFKGPAYPKKPAVLQEQLKQAVAFLRRREVRDYLAGPALFEAWAKAMEAPDKENEQATLDHFNNLLDPAIWDLAERRHYANVVLSRLAPTLGEAGEKLLAAGAEFKAIHDLMWKINAAGGEKNPGKRLKKLTDPAVRKEIAGLIREAAVHDAKAADFIAAALPRPAAPTTQQSKGQFETDRLVIRRFTRDDWRDVQAIAVDKESTPFARFDHPWPTDEQGAKGMTDFLAKRDDFYAAALKKDGKVVGLIHLGAIEKDNRRDLGHVFLQTAAKEGYTAEALARMVKHAFADPATDGIFCHNPDGYEAQLAPLAQLGMKVLGKGKGSLQNNAQGRPIEFTTCTMGISRKEWKERSR